MGKSDKAELDDLFGEFVDEQAKAETAEEPKIEPKVEPKVEPEKEPEPPKAEKPAKEPEKPAKPEKEVEKVAVPSFVCPDCEASFDNPKSLRGHCSATGHTYPSIEDTEIVMEDVVKEPEAEVEPLVEPKVEEPKVEPKPVVEPQTEIEEPGLLEVTDALPSEEEAAEFDTGDAVPSSIVTHLYYAEKGHGKTTLAFTHPGKIYCLGFDEKAPFIKQVMFNNGDRIKVKDATYYLDKSTGEAWLETAEKSFRYINHLLYKDAKEFAPDWIVIDGLEILVRDVCEKTMRYRNNIMVFQPFNLILWQERNMYVDQIHLLASKIAKKGVIYTAYVNTRDIKIENNQVVERTREPKWAADVKYKVDTVIRVESRQTDDGIEYWAIVESSKGEKIETGLQANVFWNKELQSGGIANVYEASKQ